MRAPAVVLDANLPALKVIRSLGRKGIRVIGIVAKGGRWEHSSRYCVVRVFEHAADNDERLKNYLIDLAKELDSKPVLIPMHDDHVLFVSKFRDELKKYYRYLVPDSETLEKLVSKSGLADLADQCGIQKPDTYTPQSISDLESIAGQIKYPALIKPIFSMAWKPKKIQSFVDGKVMVVDTESKLLEIYKKLAALDDRLVVQEIIPGPDNRLVYYIGYFDRDSNPLASFVGVKERLTPIHFGSASYVVSFHDAQLVELCTRFMKQIAYQGHVGIEFKLDERDDTYKLIEVNARFGLWDGMAARCGIDFAYINYQYLLDLPNTPAPTYDAGVKWISFERDWSAFRGYRKENSIGYGEWLKSLASGRRDFAVFALDDPIPFILSSIDFVGRHIPSRQRST